MSVWSMLFGQPTATLTRHAPPDAAGQSRRLDIARRLRRQAPRCGRFAPFAEQIAVSLETGLGPTGLPSTHAEEARAVFLLSKFLRYRGLRRAAAALAMLFVELNSLASENWY